MFWLFLCPPFCLTLDNTNPLLFYLNDCLTSVGLRLFVWLHGSVWLMSLPIWSLDCCWCNSCPSRVWLDRSVGTWRLELCGEAVNIAWCLLSCHADCLVLRVDEYVQEFTHRSWIWDCWRFTKLLICGQVFQGLLTEMGQDNWPVLQQLYI